MKAHWGFMFVGGSLVIGTIGLRAFDDRPVALFLFDLGAALVWVALLDRMFNRR